MLIGDGVLIISSDFKGISGKIDIVMVLCISGQFVLVSKISKLKIVFLKHYAPTICLPLKIVQGKMASSGHLLITINLFIKL